MFSIVAVSIYIPTNSVGGFPFSTPSPALTICRVFDDGHSDPCEMIPHYSSDLHFSNNLQCQTSYHVSTGHLYIFFGEMSIRSSVPFSLIELFVFAIESYELFAYFWRLIPCQLQKFANSFSHSVDYLFVLSMISFAMQMLLSLINSHLVIFVSITLGDESEKILLQFISKSALPLFFSIGHF